MASDPPFEPRFRHPLWIVRLRQWLWWPWNWLRRRPGTVVVSTADGQMFRRRHRACC